MNPIAILQHERCRSPELLLGLLRRRAINARVFQVAEGEAVPRSCRDFAAVVLQDSWRSAHDGLAWMDAETALVRQCVDAGVPVLAQGYGAQLLARALGSPIKRQTSVQPGWMRAHVTPVGREWLGGGGTFEVFGWHCENWNLPLGSQRLLFGEHCQNLGFVRDAHLALQCALDTDEATLADWSGRLVSGLRRPRLATSADAADVSLHGADRLARLRPLALTLYGRWLDAVCAHQTPAFASARQEHEGTHRSAARVA